MTEHERLLEEFDDAYFALLMEGVANKEGEQLIALNETLQDIPEAAVPESVDKRCLETIDRHFAREQRGAGLRKAWKVLRLAAVIMGISVFLFTSAFALFEDFRAATLNLMLTVTERYMRFDIKDSDGNSRQVSLRPRVCFKTEILCARCRRDIMGGMKRHEISEKQWNRVKSVFPPERKPQGGRPGKSWCMGTDPFRPD